MVMWEFVYRMCRLISLHTTLSIKCYKAPELVDLYYTILHFQLQDVGVIKKPVIPPPGLQQIDHSPRGLNPLVMPPEISTGRGRKPKQQRRKRPRGGGGIAGATSQARGKTTVHYNKQQLDSWVLRLHHINVVFCCPCPIPVSLQKKPHPGVCCSWTVWHLKSCE